jgi:hypothetical protein
MSITDATSVADPLAIEKNRFRSAAPDLPFPSAIDPVDIPHPLATSAGALVSVLPDSSP